VASVSIAGPKGNISHTAWRVVSPRMKGEAFGMWNSGPIGCGICIQVCRCVKACENRGTCDCPGDCELTFADRVADACAAARFFRTEYKLDKVFFWGLCMGGAVAVHASARLSGPFKPAA